MSALRRCPAVRETCQVLAGAPPEAGTLSGQFKGIPQNPCLKLKAGMQIRVQNRLKLGEKITIPLNVLNFLGRKFILHTYPPIIMAPRGSHPADHQAIAQISPPSGCAPGSSDLPILRDTDLLIHLPWQIPSVRCTGEGNLCIRSGAQCIPSGPAAEAPLPNGIHSSPRPPQPGRAARYSS